jgi:hypothetical protein
MTTITLEAAIQTVSELIAEKGEEYVYPVSEIGGCYYSDRAGNPACIIGHVVAKLDPVAYQELVRIESVPILHAPHRRMGAGDVNAIIDADHIVNVDAPRTEVFLDSLQRWQDTGSTWGEALVKAQARVKEFTEVGERG